MKVTQRKDADLKMKTLMKAAQITKYSKKSTPKSMTFQFQRLLTTKFW